VRPVGAAELARELLDALAQAGVARGGLVAVAIAPGVGLGVAADGRVRWCAAVDDPAAVVAVVERELRPRWTWWSSDTAVPLVAADVRVATCWDVAAVHRLLVGGWRAEPARVWAHHQGLGEGTIPAAGARVDLFSLAEHDDDERGDAVRADGHLNPAWVRGGWAASPERLGRWAELALEVAHGQDQELAALVDRPRAAATARSESTAELLCVELAVDGLPVDRDEAEALVARFVGPRPRDDADAHRRREARDAEVLRHLPPGDPVDLRSPGQVRSLLRRVGIEVPDTRAWRLEGLRDAHPVVEALLAWRKAERVATTYGYGWLDEHVGSDGRLRGAWTGSDGAAGRMTASAGLHNLPADLRGAVIAEAGHAFVRADLGQIEPRVLAAVSGDAALARATLADDMYAPVAEELGVERATAKVAVLGAMYGQTTGHGAQALRGLARAYPVAMAYLDAADRSGQIGRDLRTYGGRAVRMGGGAPAAAGSPGAGGPGARAGAFADVDVPRGDGGPGAGGDERAVRSRAAAMGRYGRNAMVQGAAAELFKVWAVTVRARAAPLGARIVLCLHDELLVHTPVERGEAVAQLLEDCLQEAATRWAPDRSVRFVAEIGVLRRWADAKG
jgi:DNA polymerase I